MLYSDTLKEICTRIEDGIEYKIALFYLLCPPQDEEAIHIAFAKRKDVDRIVQIIQRANIDCIQTELRRRELTLFDCSFDVPCNKHKPSDVVMCVKNSHGEISQIGIFVKSENADRLKISSSEFITYQEKIELKQQLKNYAQKYIDEMTEKYGTIHKWFRKEENHALENEYIDLMRNAIIDNWSRMANNERLINILFHTKSPFEYWIYDFTSPTTILTTNPIRIETWQANQISVHKYEASYITFYLGYRCVGRLQIQFPHGFLEESNSIEADFLIDDTKISLGQPLLCFNIEDIETTEEKWIRCYEEKKEQLGALWGKCVENHNFAINEFGQVRAGVLTWLSNDEYRALKQAGYNPITKGAYSPSGKDIHEYMRWNYNIHANGPKPAYYVGSQVPRFGYYKIIDIKDNGELLSLLNRELVCYYNCKDSDDFVEEEVIIKARYFFNRCADGPLRFYTFKLGMIIHIYEPTILCKYIYRGERSGAWKVTWDVINEYALPI